MSMLNNNEVLPIILSKIKSLRECRSRYANYLYENLEKNIIYAEYIAESLDKSISYADHISDSLDKNISYGEYIEINTHHSDY